MYYVGKLMACMFAWFWGVLASELRDGEIHVIGIKSRSGCGQIVYSNVTNMIGQWRIAST